MENKIVRRDQTAWNIAEQHSRFVGSLVVSGWKKFESGELVEWFWKFNLLREVVGHDLTDPEIIFLDNCEKRIFKLLPRQVFMKNKTLFKQEVLKYSRKIHKILKAQGYFPTKEDRTRLSF